MPITTIKDVGVGTGKPKDRVVPSASNNTVRQGRSENRIIAAGPQDVEPSGEQLAIGLHRSIGELELIDRMGPARIIDVKSRDLHSIPIVPNAKSQDAPLHVKMKRIRRNP